MLSQCTLVSMLTLQDDVNRLIDPCWRASGNPFLRAAMMEAAEALDHHGWKWWKKHSIDLPQLQLELVDIWHFLLSDWIIAHPTKDFEALSALLLSNRSRATSLRLMSSPIISMTWICFPCCSFKWACSRASVLTSRCLAKSWVDAR